MHVSPVTTDSDVELEAALQEVDRITTQNIIVRALQIMLADDDVAVVLAYLNDYAHLALTCKRLYEHGLQLGLYGHWFQELQEVRLDLWIEERGAVDLQEVCQGMETMCESCGTRPGLPWLAYTECQACYEDHTE